ncbi:MAG: hypothetical protein Fur0021_03680 [Candidatus Promineifilaceae bacterium]
MITQAALQRDTPPRWVLPAILLAFTCLVALTSRAIPPFEGPDGPEHFAYVIWLAEGNGFPPQGAAAWDTPLQQEASQPPLYYALAAAALRLAGISQFDQEPQRNPHFPSDAPGHVPDNKNVLIHNPQLSPWQDGWGPVYLARLVSWLAGLLLLLSIYCLARETLPTSTAFPAIAALVAALNPQVIFQSSIVSNDIAAAAASAFALWLWARLMQRGPTPRRAVALGAALGLAALTKTNTLVLIVPVALGLLWLWRRTPAARRRLLLAALLTAAALLVGGWWYLRAWLLWGSPFGLDTHCYAIWAYCDDLTRRPSPLAQWREVYYSFWAAFGWGNIKPPAWVYTALTLILLLAGVGWFKLLHRWRSRPLTFPGVLLLLLTLALLLQMVALELWMRQVTAPHGRLLFPALGAVVLLLALGWQAGGRLLPPLALSALACLSLGSWAGLIRPAYAPPRLLSAAEVALQITQPLDWRFGDLAVLLGVEPLVDTVNAGNPLPLRLCWRTLNQSPANQSVFVQLVGPENEIVAARRTYPGLGSYPTSQWPVGVQFCDVVRVEIPPNLPRSLQYKIEVGLLHNATNVRVPVFNPDGFPRADQFAAAVLLRANQTPVPVPAGSGPIRLQNVTISPDWQPGSQPTVTLDWVLAEPIPADYTVYVHLRRHAASPPLIQADAPPVAGWYPTSLWSIGELVRDVHTFTLPPDFPPGDYLLFAGWYDPHTNTRFSPEFPLGPVPIDPPHNAPH